MIRCLVVGLLVVSTAAVDEFFADLDDDAVKSDPVLFKTDYAAKYASADLRKDKKLLDAEIARHVTSADGKLTVSCSTGPVYELVIAFGETFGEEGADDVSASTAAKQGHLTWLENALGLDDIIVSKPIADIFYDVSADLKDACDAVLKQSNVTEQLPRNVLVTGAGDAAGPAAQVGALWAAAHYPSGHVLLQQFGGGFPGGNGRYNWSMDQLVDHFFVWPTKDEIADIGSGKLAEYSLTEVFDKLDGGLFDSDKRDIRSDLRELLQMATTVSVVSSNGTDLTYLTTEADHANATKSEQGQMETVQLPDWSNSTYEEQLKEVIGAYMASNDTCPIMLCKSRFLLLLAGAIYGVDGVEGSPITAVFPGKSKELRGENSADAVIMWDEKNRAAYIISEGTSSVVDIASDLSFIQRDYPTSEAYEELFDEPEVAGGFREQFLELTSDAAEENDVERQLEKMMEGETPRMVYLAGHSLGGAVATLFAPWAARKWPKATILAVTSGAPRGADQDFVDYYRTLVGRQLRYVQERDVVPASPPLDYVKHVGKGVWIHEDGVVLQERPQYDLTEYNAADHNSYLYSYIPSTVSNVSIPAWVVDM